MTANATTHEDPLRPGATLTRGQVHALYGGRPQGAISPSRTSRRVLVFVGHRLDDPTTPQDGWTDDGLLNLTGEGSRGDQEMKQANKALLNAKQEQREVHVFQTMHGSSSGSCRYVGQFELDEQTPYYFEDAPDPDGGTRRVIVFRLRPLGEVAPGIAELGEGVRPTTVVTPVQPPIDVVRVRSDYTRPYALAAPAKKLALMQQLAAHLHNLGHVVGRAQISVAGVRGQLMTDLVDRTTNTLFEVKNSSARGEIRMAIGQLLDYQRHMDHPSLAVVVPAEPYPDLIDLCTSLGIEVLWPDPDLGFKSSRT